MMSATGFPLRFSACTMRARSVQSTPLARAERMTSSAWSTRCRLVSSSCALRSITCCCSSNSRNRASWSCLTRSSLLSAAASRALWSRASCCSSMRVKYSSTASEKVGNSSTMSGGAAGSGSGSAVVRDARSPRARRYCSSSDGVKSSYMTGLASSLPARRGGGGLRAPPSPLLSSTPSSAPAPLVLPAPAPASVLGSVSVVAPPPEPAASPVPASAFVLAFVATSVSASAMETVSGRVRSSCSRRVPGTSAPRSGVAESRASNT
mmetsp:Transcript_12195/g.38992  ORF Transcript_12195/g.38992 Transcript_12195/m.38992 type:complete len:265 (-) Transcript_12195:948-1742(-)